MNYLGSEVKVRQDVFCPFFDREKKSFFSPLDEGRRAEKSTNGQKSESAKIDRKWEKREKKSLKQGSFSSLCLVFLSTVSHCGAFFTRFLLFFILASLVSVIMCFLCKFRRAELSSNCSKRSSGNSFMPALLFRKVMKTSWKNKRDLMGI